MLTCFECGKETPMTNFYLLKQYSISSHSRYWHFCSADCLLEWLKEQDHIARFGINKPKLITWDWEGNKGKEIGRKCKELNMD